MRNEPPEIYEHRAALLAWHQEHVGQAQRIYVAEDSSTLLRQMHDEILRCANLLYNRYAAVLDAADFMVIRHHLAAGEPAGTPWNHEDIKRLLRQLLEDKHAELARYDRYQSILGLWYDLVEWLNDLLPGANYLRIGIEDSVPNFVPRLFEHYCDWQTVYRHDQAPEDIAWLGRLALLRLAGAWWDRPEGLDFFQQVVAEHNRLFGFY
jgi:hypothetical protein